MDSIMNLILADIADFSTYGIFVALCRLFVLIVALESVTSIFSYLGGIRK